VICSLIVVAAGSSQRFGADKLWVLLPDGRPLWRGSVDALGEMNLWRDRVLVVSATRKGEFERLLPPGWQVVVGGESRLESVRAGVMACDARSEYVAIHDAARPFVTAELAERVVRAAQGNAAAFPSIPVTDTVHWERGDRFVAPPRSQLSAAQTPQVINKAVWMAVAPASAEFTDDVGPVASAGHPIVRVDGDPRNRKITTPDDLSRLVWETRTGWGYDIHRFSDDPERPMWLGGVEFDERPGLEGHSDADALLHALVDALLGAASMGDIGVHYPPSDPQWRGCASVRFVEETARRLRQENWSIVNLDLTVVGERPRIGPRRGAIISAVARTLDLDLARVNVKATTNEGLGALGRGEGVAAMAVATITRPR